MEQKTAKEKAYEAVYQSYFEDVYRVCLHLTKDEEQARDCSQETFIKFYEQFQDVDKNCAFAYLVRIAKNVVHNHQKTL